MTNTMLIPFKIFLWTEKEALRTLSLLILSSGCQADKVGGIMAVSTDEEIGPENSSAFTSIIPQVGGGLGPTLDLPRVAPQV